MIYRSIETQPLTTDDQARFFAWLDETKFPVYYGTLENPLPVNVQNLRPDKVTRPYAYMVPDDHPLLPVFMIWWT